MSSRGTTIEGFCTRSNARARRCGAKEVWRDLGPQRCEEEWVVVQDLVNGIVVLGRAGQSM